MPLCQPRHFILTTFGSAGDVYPLIAIGRALLRRGHRVTILTNEYFSPRILDAGLEFLSLGSREEYLDFLQNPDFWHPRKSFGLVANFIVETLRPFYQKLADLSPRESVLVAPGLSLWTRLLQEKLGWKLATLHLQPSMLWSADDTPVMPGFRFPDWVSPPWKRRVWRFLNHWVTDRPLAPELNRFRRQLGLAPVQDIFLEWMHSPQLVLGAFPHWFAPPQKDWPPHTHLTGFVFYDSPSPNAEEEHRTLDAIRFCEEGDAPLLFTPGSAMLHGRKFFEESRKACKVLSRRAIFITPQADQIPQNLPPGIRHYPYLPFDRVAPHLSGIVHHGGIGTSAQALRAGIPQLLVPLTHDQPDNAARLERLGVSGTLPTPRYSCPNIVKKLQALFKNARTLENCKTFSQKILQEKDGAVDTADWLEGFSRQATYF